jgi:hypothetical protein
MKRTMILALAAASLSPAAPGGAAPGARPAPEVEAARDAGRAADSQAREYEALAEKLRAAVDRYQGTLGHVNAGVETLAAFQDYAEAVLKSGQELLDAHREFVSASRDMANLLRRTPAYFDQAARLNRERSEKARFTEIKSQYVAVAEMWEALAERTRREARELDVDAAGDGQLAFLEEQNSFLADLLGDLKALPHGSGVGGPEYRRLVELTANQAGLVEALRANLAAFTRKVRAGR